MESTSESKVRLKNRPVLEETPSGILAGTSEARAVEELGFLQAFFDESPLGYLETDRQGRIVRVNETAARLLGRRKSEMLGTTVFDPADDFSRSVFFKQIQTETALPPFERCLFTSDHHEIVVSLEERLERDQEGRVTGLIQILRDVTEMRRNEIALNESKRKARALFEGIDEAVFVHSAGGRILDANPAACRLLGYTLEEMLKLSTDEIDDAEFALGYAERLTRQLAEGRLICQGMHRTKSGRVIPVQIITSAIMLDDRQAVLAVFRDISEKIALESTRKTLAEKNAELTLSAARYRGLTEGSLDGVIVFDHLGVVTLLNPSAERIFEINGSEVLGKPVSTLLPEAFPHWDEPDVAFGPWLRGLDPALVGKTVELVGKRRNNEPFPLELSLNFVEVAGQLQFIGSIRDQTERQKMRAMLVQNERLASIGLLSAGVAHEINNPLSYVGNNLVVLERDFLTMLELVKLHESSLPTLAIADFSMAETITAYAEDFDWPYVRENLPGIIERTRDGVQRIAAIVSSLRGLARTSSPTMEQARIPDLFESAIEMVRGRLRRRHIEIVVENEVAGPLICVGAQISQVLLNLLVNATQAVESRFENQEGGRIRFRSQEVDGMVVLSIQDNGCGIPLENIPRLFDPFFTTKSIGEGTGLGLSICHGIITGHGGRIEVESILGVGTTLKILLPKRLAK